MSLLDSNDAGTKRNKYFTRLAFGIGCLVVLMLPYLLFLWLLSIAKVLVVMKVFLKLGHFIL
jgi:p-aminobenzoyl-glutamate transporter AbgT